MARNVHSEKAKTTKAPTAKAKAAEGARLPRKSKTAKKTASRNTEQKAPPIVSVDLVQARADFVRYYIEQDFRDAAAAYKRAYGEKSADVACASASRLLADVKVQEAMAAELTAVLAERRVPLEKRILDTWIIRAFYDPTEIIDLHGKLKITVAELRKKGLSVCIDSINKKMNQSGKSYIEYKLADRDKALDMLQKYIAMIKEPDKNVNLNVGSGVLKVAATMSAEDWAKAAIAQQDALMSAGKHE
jgi:phage terminase small subunit